MAVKGKGIVRKDSSGKRLRDDSDKSGGRRRKNPDVLQFFDIATDVDKEEDEDDLSDDFGFDDDEMKESSDKFVRADQIDLKSLDEQLEWHLSRARTMEKKEGGKERVTREEWKIDPSKLIIKGVIARGTFGTIHRGIYDGLDVAGESFAERDDLRRPRCS